MIKIKTLELQKAVINNQIKKEKKIKHKSFVQEHKTYLRLLDILVIIAVVMNFGALFLTNIMVSEKSWDDAKVENTTVVYKEANPAAEKIYGFAGPETKEQKQKALIMISRLFKQAMLWCIILFLYIITRKIMITEQALYILTFIVLWYFVLLGSDFILDLGLYVGKLLFGG